MEQLHTRLAAEHREKAEALMKPSSFAHTHTRDEDGRGPYPDPGGEEA
jgi:hypothetical protein